MAKIFCQCGEELLDNTSQSPYKSWFLADQDIKSFQEKLSKSSPDFSFSSFQKYFGKTVQCIRCGNLVLFSQDGKNRYDFSPTSPTQPRNITQSYLKKKWKGSIIASYYTSDFSEEDKQCTGEIFWNTNDDHGFNQKLSLEQLGTFYYQLKSQFRKQGILDYSIFKIDEEIQDEWKNH